MRQGTHMNARTRKHAHTDQYVILFSTATMIHESDSVLRYTYIACLVTSALGDRNCTLRSLYRWAKSPTNGILRRIFRAGLDLDGRTKSPAGSSNRILRPATTMVTECLRVIDQKHFHVFLRDHSQNTAIFSSFWNLPSSNLYPPTDYPRLFWRENRLHTDTPRQPLSETICPPRSCFNLTGSVRLQKLHTSL